MTRFPNQRFHTDRVSQLGLEKDPGNLNFLQFEVGL
jgi:hypothetical protein